jgi:septation ring formation regulator EzrA
MKTKLDNLDVSVKNFKEAITQGDRLAAQKRLNAIGDTVKELEALIAN